MDANGCVCSESNIFVTEPSVANEVEIREYTKDSLPRISARRPRRTVTRFSSFPEAAKFTGITRGMLRVTRTFF